MITVLLATTTVICACGWLAHYITATVLLWYLQEKNIPFPSPEEMKRGSKWVVTHMFKDMFARKNRR